VLPCSAPVTISTPVRSGGGDDVVVEQKQTEALSREGSSDLAHLLKRAEHGDLGVLPALRQLLTDNPRLWQGYGDLAAQAEGALIRLAAGNNLLLSESLIRKLADLKHELGGESPSPLERLLIERVTTTWLQVNHLDALVAQAQASSPQRLKMLQAEQDAAHRRHLTAIKTLATVRKLLMPALSPVQIATRLAGERPLVHAHNPAAGVPIEN
jgi:hypothetical protein